MSFLSSIIAHWKMENRVDAEVDTFPASELEALGLSRAEFRRIAHMPQEQIDRMEKMARVFGASMEAVRRSGEQILVASRCANCSEQGQCRRTLADHPTADNCDFCPNAETYSGLAQA